MSNYAKYGIAAATIAAAVLIAVVWFAEPSKLGGPAPETPVPTATPTPPRLDDVPEGSLAAGRYAIDQVFPVALSFTIPDGFTHGRGVSDNVGVHWDGSGSPRGIEFQIVTNVYADPCRTSTGVVDPPIGRTVDDLVAAMRTLPGFEAGEATDVTIGGLPAKAFDLTNNLDPSSCDQEMIAGWQLANGSASGIGSGQRQRIYVMDVGGERLVIMTYHFVESDAAEAVTMVQEIVNSIEFP